MGNTTLIVSSKRATIRRTLLGGLQVAYPCPRCRDQLITKNDVSLGDKCPRCATAFDFDDEIKKTFSAFVAEKQSRDAQLAAQKVEQQRLLEAEKEERAREAVAAEAEYRLLQKIERAEAVRIERDAEQQAKRAFESAARSIDEPYQMLAAILAMAWIATAIVSLAAFVSFANSNAEAGGTLLIVGVSSAVTLTLVYVFFRTLRAIHTVLVMILDRLESSSG
jgi:DNA-directed RNA polymerase subunit M/transcription elongation factor TFIIS